MKKWRALLELIIKYITCEGSLSQTQFYHLRLLMIFKGHPVNMPYFFLNSVHKMAYTYQTNIGDKERSLFHHGLNKILVSYRLGELGETWESFLMCNRFGGNEEWPKQRPRVRRRHIKNEETEPGLEESGSQDNLGDEISKPSQTLSINDVKVNIETNSEVPADNSQARMRKPPITIPCQNKDLPHSQADIGQTLAEDQTS